MTRRLSFHPLAEIELNDAAQYYDRASPGLGHAFIAAVEHCAQAIAEYPDAGTPLNGIIRRRSIDAFPYALLYRATGDAIRILAVMNLKRRPFYWIGRE